MVTITVGSDRREFRDRVDIDESWLNRVIDGRRGDGLGVCIEVLVSIPGRIDARLTAGCPPTGGGSRRPNQDEERLFELWTKCVVSHGAFRGGHVISFLKQMDW